MDPITPNSTPKVTYDEEANAIYIYLQEPKPGISKKTIEIDVGDFKTCVYLDLDNNDQPVGFELLLDYPTEEGKEILKKHFDIRKQHGRK